MRKALILTVLFFGFYGVSEELSELKFGPREELKGKGVDSIIAIVGDDVITRKELKTKNITADSPELQSLIMRKILLQEAKKFNIVVGDTALNLSVDKIKNSETVKDRKNRLSKSTTSYRNSIREEMIISRLQKRIANGLVKISDREVNDLLESKLKSNTDSVNLVDILIKVPPTADSRVLKKAYQEAKEIRHKLESNPISDVLSQHDNATYTDLSWVSVAKLPAKFAKVIVSTEKGQYTAPIVDRDGLHILRVVDKKAKQEQSLKKIKVEETKAAHILIKANPKDQQSIASAKKQIDNIVSQIKKGIPFEKLAKNYSQDYASAADNGSLGWVLPGQMVPRFEEVMRKTKTNTISPAFKSTYGWHIIKVYARRDKELTDKNSLEQQVKQTLFQKKARQEWEQWVSRVRDEAFVEIKI